MSVKTSIKTRDDFSNVDPYRYVANKHGLTRYAVKAMSCFYFYTHDTKGWSRENHINMIESLCGVNCTVFDTEDTVFPSDQ